MPRLALRFDPAALPERLDRLAATWERLLNRSKRPVETSRTVLPGFAAVQVLLRFFDNRPQPAVSDDAALYLWLDGEIWDRASARQDAGLSSGAAVFDADLCLRLYLRFGDRFCERMHCVRHGHGPQSIVENVIWMTGAWRLSTAGDQLMLA